MATPSSSQTTPSPSLAHANPLALSGTDASAVDAMDSSPAQKGLQRFLARAELSKLTRGLRARLSYASYKASNNLTGVPLRTLEVQLERKATPPSPSKRKAAGGNTVHNNSGAQGNGTMDPRVFGSSRRPPASPYSNATQDLYSALLGPSMKRARTIHNAQLPPITSPIPARLSKNPGSNKKNAKNVKSKGKKKEPPARRAESQSSLGEESSYQDIQAAAALTDMLLSRPAPTASPRSSMSTVSEAGSIYMHPPSLPQQYSTRVGSGLQQASTSSSMLSIPPEMHRSSTPTPKAGPSRSLPSVTADSEAADLILSFANSPSPARPAGVRDAALSRNIYAAGRVLFPSSQDSSLRSTGGSFSSTLSITGGDHSGDHEKSSLASSAFDGLFMGLEGMRSPGLSMRMPGSPLRHSTITPPMQTGGSFGLLNVPTASQLLHPSSPASNRRSAAPVGLPMPTDTRFQQPSGPSTPAFDMSEYVNASPSPLVTPGRNRIQPNLVGRRLFENEASVVSGKKMRFPEVEGGALGAGFDMVKT